MLGTRLRRTSKSSSSAAPRAGDLPGQRRRKEDLPDSRQVQRRGGPPPWALGVMRSRGLRRLVTFVAAVLCLALVVAVSGVRVTRGHAGTVGVVRNGGPLDARTIRQVIMPGQSLTYIGMFSQSPHTYPASQVTLKYSVTSYKTKRPQPAVDTIVVPTKDGVQVGLDAAVFFRFVGESDIDTLQAFDKSVGTRRFATPDGRRLYPWQGDEGFGAMLDSLFRPVLENDLRKEVGQFPCATLVSSCSLVRQGAAKQVSAPGQSIAAIETRINDSLVSDLQEALGLRFFMDVQFRVARVTLPTNVQEAVDDAQAQFAAVNSAQAELRQARFTARRNRLLGATYNRSPGLAAIEALKAIPKGSTVFISPGGRAPSIIAGTGGAAAASPADGQGDASAGKGAE